MNLGISKLNSSSQGRNQHSNLGGEVLCSKNLKNWNINTRGWQSSIISINFINSYLYFFFWKKKFNNRIL